MKESHFWVAQLGKQFASRTDLKPNHKSSLLNHDLISMRERLKQQVFLTLPLPLLVFHVKRQFHFPVGAVGPASLFDPGDRPSLSLPWLFSLNSEASPTQAVQKPRRPASSCLWVASAQTVLKEMGRPVLISLIPIQKSDCFVTVSHHQISTIHLYYPFLLKITQMDAYHYFV